jgi:hypothetical protein
VSVRSIRSTGLLKLPIFMFSSVRALRALDGAKEIEARSIAKPFAQSFGRNQMRKATATSARAGARGIWGRDRIRAKCAMGADVVSFSVRNICRNVWRRKRKRTSLWHWFEGGPPVRRSGKNRQISPEAMRSEVPIGVTMYLAGPSVDFIIGRVFEGAMGDVYDDIVKRRNGIPLPSSDWVMDEAIRKPEEKHRYVKGQL